LNQPGHTIGMKTAISIPDDIFENAERLARRTKKSRSQLFSDAIKEYLARHAADDITESMDRVFALNWGHRMNLSPLQPRVF
jgi:antitoxin MazE6